MSQCSGEISFYERFEKDIVAGAKTITLRDESESHFKAGQRISVSTFEKGRWFCDIEIESVSRVAFSELNEEHAKQENMSLNELKAVIIDIYGEIDTLYAINFRLVSS